MTLDPRPIALVGLSGAGKSAVARRLAARLGCAAADLDDDIEAAAGAPAAALFARHGEPWFREREAAALAAAVERAGVIACGGGIVTSAAARDTLRERCRVAWLEVSVDEALRRLGSALATRPLLAGGAPAAGLAALLAARRDHYAALAAVRVPTDGRTADEVAAAVADALAGVGR